MTRMILTSFFVYALIVSGSGAAALEALSPAQMKTTVARAGLDLSIGGLRTETHLNSLTVSNPDQDPVTQSLRFDQIHLLSSLSIGLTDADGDGTVSPLTLDLGAGPRDDQAMLVISAPDLDLFADITVSNIHFCGQDLGSMAIEGLRLSSLALAAGPPADPGRSAGLDFELGGRIGIDTFRYDYNASQALVVSGFALMGFDPLDSRGTFRIGDVAGGNPGTLDIGVNGAGDRACLAMNLPVSGSVRIEALSLGGTDFGAFTLDGIQADTLYIEFPGRGLGLGTP